jgi:hypothetical protein
VLLFVIPVMGILAFRAWRKRNARASSTSAARRDQR